jgi:hypothetical protein
MLNVPLALVPGGLEKGLVILGGQMLAQHRDRRERHIAPCYQLKDDRIPPRGPRRFNSVIRRVLREAQHLGAVREER